MNSQHRLTRPETIQELRRQLGRLFPQAKISEIQEHTSGEISEAEADATRLTILLGAEDESTRAGCEVTLDRQFDDREARFIRFFGRVFNEDLKSAPSWGRDEELWLSLQQTRLARVIARVTPFHTPIFLKWLRTLENAQSLRYEAQPFSTQIVLTKQIEWIRDNRHAEYVRFSDRMSLTRALFEEKWTRSLAADGELSLVGLGHDRGIVGVVHVHPLAQCEGPLVPPHSSLSGFCSMLVPGTLGLLASRHGDLRILLPNGVTFMKSQGHWAMINLRLLEDTLGRMLDQPIAAAVMRLAADLSYEGQGALLCCVEKPSSIAEVVPDHSSKGRVGQSLRMMSRRLNVTRSGHQKILKRIAMIDGAIVLAPDGSILDSACMISDPSSAKLEESGIAERIRFAGARSTAAWNASLHGIAIKISEDGPITVFNRGNQILQI